MKLSTAISLCALALAPAFAAQERSAPSSSGAQPLGLTTADSDSGPEVQAVLARTDELNQAFVHSDVATLDRIIADECLQIIQNGARTKAEWLAPYRSGASRFESIKPPEWRRVRLYGDVAVVTSAAEIVMVVQGERRPSRFFNTRTWAKRSGQWYLVLAQNTPRPEETGVHVTTANANENLGQTSSAPATPNGAENTIRELDKHATKALLEGNIEAISKLWADDFVGIGPTGRTRTKAELIEGHRQRLLKLESTEAIEPPRIRMYNNDTATVMIHARSKGKSGDRDTSGEYRGLWVWAKRNENWQIVSYQSSLVPPGLGATEKDARSQSADKAGNAEQEVRQVERELTEALGRGDVRGVDRIYAHDYTLTTADGELQNKGQRIAALKATDPKSVNRSRDDITVRVYGDTAVVTGHTLFRSQAQDSPKGEDRRFTHVFVRRQGQWQMVTSQVTRISAQSQGTEANKALVRSYIEATNSRGHGDEAVIDEFIAPDFIRHGGKELRGIASFKQNGVMVQAAFPDWKWTIEDLLAEGDKVVVRMTGRGTQRGEFQDIPPTDKPVTLDVVMIYRIAAGKIVEQWRTADDLGRLRQLGATIAPPGQPK